MPKEIPSRVKTSVSLFYKAREIWALEGTLGRSDWSAVAKRSFALEKKKGREAMLLIWERNNSQMTRVRLQIQREIRTRST